jgi:hypothetical protein
MLRVSQLLPMSLALAGALALTSCADHSGTFVSETDTTSPNNTDGNPEILSQLPPKPSTSETPPESPQPPGSGGPPFTGGGDGTDGTAGGAGPVPEPSTLLFVGTGLAGIALLRRRRRTPEPS